MSVSLPAPVADGSSDPGRRVERLRCGLAGAEDDDALRRLLRDAPMEGWVRLAFPREPSYFAAQKLEGVGGATIVVRRRRDGAVVGMGSRSVKEVHLDGRPARVGYLGQLRFAPGWRAGRRTLEEGYALARSLRSEDELPFDLTAVVDDNLPARRLLERGLPGLPRYTPLTELVTLVVDTRSGVGTGERRARPGGGVGVHVEYAGDGSGLDAMAERLHRRRDTLRLAPRWRRGRLAELMSGRFGPWRPLIARDGDVVVGCAAVWDQRPFRQCVVRGYAPGLAPVRPALSVVRRLLGRPGLPAPGAALRLGYLSHLAADDPGTMGALVAAARAHAVELGLDHLALGLPAGRPELDVLQGLFGGHAYRSVIYAVHDAGLDPEFLAFDGGNLHVEVATL
jgi:hypothetical protein